MTDKEKLEAVRAEIHRLVDVCGYPREMANALFIFMDSLPNEPLSKDLEEAIGEYCSNPDNFATWIGGDETDDIRLIIKAIEFGTQWKEQQMMKDAVDGCCISNGKEVGSAIKSPIGMVFLKYDKFNVGDKVKLIVIKEDLI